MTNFQRGYGEILPDWVPDEEDWVTEKEAKRREFTRLCQGALAGAVLAFGAMVASAAWGETVHIGRHFIAGEPREPSFITIAPSPKPGELAVVTFQNNAVNQEEDNGSREIATADVAVSVRFTFDYNPVTGADRITVTPPEGITCLPADCSVTVLEGFTGTVVLLDWIGS